MKPASSSRDPNIQKILKEMESLKAEYPADLLAARRAAFLKQVGELSQVEKEFSPHDQQVINLLTRLKSVEEKYPEHLLAARRAGYVRQVEAVNRLTLLSFLRSVLQKIRIQPADAPQFWTKKAFRSSLIAASLAIAAFAGFLVYGNLDQTPRLAPAPAGSVQSGRILTSDGRESRIICKAGYQPPLCLAGEYVKTQDLTYQENGLARPAVAKDTNPDSEGFHRASYINDGLYGPGSSWISNSPNSWIKIDLGRVTPINTVEFGRDRLGEFDDRNPGQFVIAVAVSDDVYADGNNSNDQIEYTEVFDSEQVGFNGDISAAETVTAQFEPQPARFVKITFENRGAAIDEVEVFMVQPPMADTSPTRRPEDGQPEATATPVPTSTPLPVDTATPVPTTTSVPTVTPSASPTNTPVPPTDTPLPTDTDTPLPEPTDPPPATDSPGPGPVDIFPPTQTPEPEPEPVEATLSANWPPGLLNRDRIRPTRNPVSEP